MRNINYDGRDYYLLYFLTFQFLYAVTNSFTIVAQNIAGHRFSKIIDMHLMLQSLFWEILSENNLWCIISAFAEWIDSQLRRNPGSTVFGLASRGSGFRRWYFSSWGLKDPRLNVSSTLQYHGSFRENTRSIIYA